jgi:hypothetical protein
LEQPQEKRPGITNSIIWGNAAGSPKTGGNYRLNSGSPAINAGDNSRYPASASAISPLLPPMDTALEAAIEAALPKDLGGSNRKQGAIDMGAYERQ